MKYNTFCVTLLVGAALLVLPSTQVRAANDLYEDWHDQVVGPMPVQMPLWQHLGNEASGSGQILAQNDKKILEIKATSIQQYQAFGIKSQDAISWSDSVEMSVDVAFAQDEHSPMPAQYLPSFILIISGGGTGAGYAINVRPNHIQIARNDHEHPNPNPAAPNPDYTPLFKSKEQQTSFISDDFHNFKLKIKRSGGGIQITLLHDQEETELGTITDSTPANLGDAVNVGIAVENYAILKIGNVKVTTH